MNISPARLAAYDILLRIETDRAYSSVLLPQFETYLSNLDRGLCHEITLGTLRRQIYIDRHIDLLARGKKLDVEVRIALRIALYQLFFLDKVPQYSAINESVNLVQRAKKTSAKGFVNAILRRATREKLVLEYENEIDRLAIETSHPHWLIEKWVASFGFERTSSLAHANNEMPARTFRVVGTPNDDGKRLIELSRASPNTNGCFIYEGDDQLFLNCAERGEIYIQDEASQIAARAVELAENFTFLDVCAAPGGKTGLIGKRYSGSSPQIIAGDIYRQRVEYLRDNCRHQGLDFIQIVQYDAEKGLPFAGESFDVVLVDAPCSGTGTIRHNPELRYLIGAGDILKLASKQLTILDNASELVRPGGTMFYSTCSVEPEENETVCDKFLEGNQDFCQIRPEVGQQFITPQGFGRTWPDRDNMDGFFIGAFRRNQ